MLNSTCIRNGNLCHVDDLNLNHDNHQVIYEVIRVINGKALFLDEHLSRLKSSFNQIFVSQSYNFNELEVSIHHFLLNNYIATGNFRIEIFLEEQFIFHIFQIPSVYPKQEMYINGVNLVFQVAERKYPSAKLMQTAIRDNANQLLKNQSVYETALVNTKGEITEGSRSNLFFIKGQVLFSAVDSDILSGITRMKILELCDKHGIEVIKTKIHKRELTQFDSAFMCGTSPMILPIKQIEDIDFNPQNPLLIRLTELYHQLVMDIVK